MSDLRHDPINDQWVSVATNRRERPMEFVPMEQTLQRIICPFCKGNEDETPNALAAYDEFGNAISRNEASPWSVRVVPNKYPSFSNKNGELTAELVEPGFGRREASDQYKSGPFRVSTNHGIQELIIPSSRHVTSLTELTDEELKVSFKAYQDRIKHAQSLDYIQHAMLFMNCRLAAGASLGHIHTQLIGSPVVSSRLQTRVSRNQEHFSNHGCSLIESLADWEIKEKLRIVKVTENFCIVCPFASRFAFQAWIIPLTHATDFLECPDSMRDELSVHCRNLVKNMEQVIDNPSYNMLFHLDPFQRTESNENAQSSSSDRAPSSWYVELFPRLTRAAGFEWGTDIWVNPISPESAARRLRDRD